MAEEGASRGDKTETATSRHVSQARDAGRVPISREATVFGSLTAVFLVLIYQAQSIILDLLPALKAFLARADMSGVAGAGEAVRDVFGAVAPMLIAATIGAAAAVLLQTGFLFSGSVLSLTAS